MTEIDMKPKENEANIVPFVEGKDLEIILPFQMMLQAVNAGLSSKALFIAGLMMTFEDANGHHTSLGELYETTGTVCPVQWIRQGLEELMARNLAFWYEEGGSTYYILKRDFSLAKEA